MRSGVRVSTVEGHKSALGSRIGLRRLSQAGKALIGKIGGGDQNNTYNSLSSSNFTGINMESDILSWRARGEKCVRDNLLLFFLYIFADLDDYYRPCAATQANSKNDDNNIMAKRRATNSMKDFTDTVNELASGGAFASNDSRSSFDLSGFLLKKKDAEVGMSNELLFFLKDFIHSQLFEQHCESRKKAIESQYKDGLSVFDQAVAKMRERTTEGKTSVTISGIKDIIASLSTSTYTIASNHHGSIGVGGHPMVSHFVRLRGDVPYQEEIKGEDCAFYVVSMGENNAESMKDMTSSSSSINRDLGLEKITPSLLALRMPLAADLHADMTIFSEDQYLNSMNEEHCMLYELCEDARNFGNDCGFYAVMQSVKVRLVECLSSGLRGDKGRAGARALIILQALLLYGPEAALSLSLELFDILRAMCIVKASPHSCIESIDAFDFMDNGVTPEFLEKDIKTFSRSYGGASDCVKIEAAAVLVLLLDKTSLAVKRNLRKMFLGMGMVATLLHTDALHKIPHYDYHSQNCILLCDLRDL